ncbi:MAG: VCBS repeat-containing protein, partial [Deltaproteobacteria bacterium]
GVGLFVQDRNSNANAFTVLHEQSDGTLAAAWTFALSDAEQVQAVSRGRFGASSVAGVMLQIRNTLDLPSSRHVALSEADGSTLWARTAPAPRPYIRSSLAQSAVVTCAGDRIVTCTSGCQCSVVSGVDGTSTPVPGIGGCDALNVSAGRTDAAGDTALIVGGAAYQTDLLVVHADCTVTHVAAFRSALQSIAALVDANGDARLDGAYWSDAACMHVRDGNTGSVLWSRLYLGGAAVPCTVGAPALHTQTTPAVAGDIDGDGREELLFGTVDGDLMAVSGATGDVRMQVHTQRQLRETQLADVDGDGRPEIVAGADDGYLYVFAQP